ncbi:MAG TPA: hypothetical protein VG247_11195 [Pseudonocardiaceae bacterium]|jgi:hypothetical protein|nr:hypothetical protein [Pseudonocardiaceae bacterium]
MTNSNAKSASKTNNSTWSGLVAVDDTALAVTDTRGPGTPVLYLNGSYTSQNSWQPVIGELGGNEWRTRITTLMEEKLRAAGIENP